MENIEFARKSRNGGILNNLKTSRNGVNRENDVKNFNNKIKK